MQRTVAFAESFLIAPAVVFMAALFVRNIQPQPAEPAHTAQQIVLWFAAHPPVGLWVLLMTLPFVVFATGSAALVHAWRSDPSLRDAAAQIRSHWPVLLIGVATAASAFVLVVVALHALSD